MKIEQEFSISHEQFSQGMLEMIGMTKTILETFKKAYGKNKDPFYKVEVEKYTESLVGLVQLFKSYTVRVECGIGVNPIILFSDGKALFGYRMKDEVDFSKRWYDTIAKKINGKNMVI